MCIYLDSSGFLVINYIFSVKIRADVVFSKSFMVICLPFQGIECEYRHSEIARLNPRDCWYWLAGSCLNPSCPFRHPVSSI